MRVTAAMDSSAESITSAVRSLRERAGLSMANIAKAMGFKNASSYQRYENPNEYSGGYLRRDLVAKLAKALIGHGNPKITTDEVWALAGPEFRASAVSPRLYGTFDPDDPKSLQDAMTEGEAYTRETWTPKQPGALPELDLKLGAGEGAVGEVMVLAIGPESYSGHRVVDEWVFPPAFLHNSGTSTSAAIVGEIAGDSMVPNYLPGDRVVVDLSRNMLVEDGVYMWTDGQSPPQVKRFQRVPFTNPPRVEIKSDNPAYRTFEAPLADVKILGKITWHVGRR